MLKSAAGHGSGAAWRRSPHQNLQGEREGRERKREREEREGRKEKRGERREIGEKGKRERRGRGTDVLLVQNTPLELSKNYKRHGKGEAGKRQKKRQKRPAKKMTDEKFEM